MSIWTLAGCLVALSPAGAGKPGSPVQPAPAIATVSTGQAFVMERSLYPERPTIFLFYREAMEADRKVLAELQGHANERKGMLGVRLVKLKSLADPAATAYEIHSTPMLMVLDRFGNLVKRSADMREVGMAFGQASRMARIKWVNEGDPEAATAYKTMGGGMREVPGIMKTMSLRPELMEGINRIAGMAHFTNGFLPRRTKEMIATYVSAINHCKF